MRDTVSLHAGNAEVKKNLPVCYASSPTQYQRAVTRVELENRCELVKR